jgi:hypothetical protein
MFSSQLQAQRVSLQDGRYKKSYSVSKTAKDGLGLRELRRAGISFNAAGDLGLAGAKVELNLTPQWSVGAGAGGSADFRSFSFQVTRYMLGTNFLPYSGIGIARWYGNPGQINDSTPSVLTDTLMSDSDRRDGKVRELLITPRLGLQYLTTEGPYAGYGFFAEVVVLLDIKDLVMAPTGSLGVSYYF